MRQQGAPSVQFSSVAQWCPTLCNPMNSSTPDLPVHHQLHWVSDAIQPSHPLSSPSLPAFSLSQHQGFFQWVCSTRQVTNIGASASASVFPMNSQDWFPLGLMGLISLQSKGLSGTTVWKHQLFGTQPSLRSNSHIHIWLLEKPQLWLYGIFWQSNASAFFF